MAAMHTKRVYEATDPHDGIRILVDRVWPRGVTKENADASLWLKDIAPSTTLRKWFAHDRGKWEEFKRRYYSELDTKPDVVAELRAQGRKGRVTLLYSARDTECNQAVALREYLLSHASARPR